MEKIKNLSIRKSIVLYIGIAMVISMLLSVFCMKTVEKVQQNIWKKYSNNEKKRVEFYLDDTPIYDFSRTIERISDENMSQSDAFLSNLCDFADTWSSVVITMISCVSAICLFYRNKIKRPLRILEEGSKKISNQQLDFQIQYDNKDELGKLCMEFEAMRGELENNNKKMWRMFEKERILRAAIIHDISSPLAVIKGYQETLKVFIPTGKLDEDKMLEIAEACLKQVERLNQFVNTMKQISKVEEREIRKEKVIIENLCKHIQETTLLLSASTELGFQFSFMGEGSIYADQNMIIEVFENILSNALRYAKKEIAVMLHYEKPFLEICVEDDGEGFHGDVKEAVKAYVHDDAEENTIHFGLGLYICDIYCKKHGGFLELKNLGDKGASVKAKFKVI